MSARTLMRVTLSVGALSLVTGLVTITPGSVAASVPTGVGISPESETATARDTPLQTTVIVTPSATEPEPLQQVESGPLSWPASVEVSLGGTLRASMERGSTPQVSGEGDLEGIPGQLVSAQTLEPEHAETLGIDGLVMDLGDSVSEFPGSTEVPIELDYSGLAALYGSDWASRVRLVQLPQCALTAPTDEECRTVTPLDSSIDTDKAVVQATFSPAASSVVAATASASGPGGDWTATSLSPTSSWNVSAQTGAFAWSYPLPVPPAVGGPAPELSLDYSSASQDGRVASTNNQSSWVGDGWDLTTGFIERRFAPCTQDDKNGASNAGKPTGDLCWAGENAVLVFQGKSEELVKDKTTDEWHLKRDDGTRVEYTRGHWVVTTTDGTEYYFGHDEDLSSAWKVPVAGNHDGEPCHASSFDESFCDQTWRWNLDYVEDTSRNTMTYEYRVERNWYSRNMGEDAARYDRGGYLKEIRYGQRKGDAGEAPMRVVFKVDDRCLEEDCPEPKPSTARLWPDVPFDQICQKDEDCGDSYTPTFFTLKRLETVETSVYDDVEGGYVPVDEWILTQKFPVTGDLSSPTLWLASVQHRGLDGDAVELPATRFTSTNLPNRVMTDSTTGLAIHRPRLASIATEAGGRVDVNYLSADTRCTGASTNEAALAKNVKRCFPVKWSPTAIGDPLIELFHKYVVGSVVSHPSGDAHGGAQEIHYAYDSAAWRYDDSPLVPKKDRTWNQFRGFAEVTVTEGTGADTSATKYEYFQGMHGDRTAVGGEVRDKEVNGIKDHEVFNGQVMRATTYSSGSGENARISEVTFTPWRSDPTAVDADGENAYFTGVEEREEKTYKVGGSASQTRTTRTETTFDKKFGVPEMINDLGDVAVTGDEQCTGINYVRNKDKNLTALVKRTRLYSEGCSAVKDLFEDAARPGDPLVSEQRLAYDGGDYGDTPTRGLVTRTETLSHFTSDGNPRYVSSQVEHDNHGRVTSSADALGRTTTTKYTPATGGPLTKISTTSPDPDGTASPLSSHTEVSTLSPRRGIVTKHTDANGRVAERSLDGLGRTTAVWLPGRSKGTDSASSKYRYRVGSGVNVIETSVLTHAGGYRSSTEIFDGLLRPRQTQTPSASASELGTIVTDTYYDARGLVRARTSPWYSALQPSMNVVEPVGSVPGLTEYRYDGAGRLLEEKFFRHGNAAWSTTTSYGGDRVKVIPPNGGITEERISDVRGRIVELRQYTSASAYQATGYTYDRAGRLASMRDPLGNTWSNTYDLLGRLKSSRDPDRGTTLNDYDAAGQLTKTTDARGQAVAYTYDDLGRKTSERLGSTTGQVISEWVYDTTLKGQLTSSTSYHSGSAYTTEVTSYDAAYRVMGRKVTLPEAEGALKGSYSTSYAYLPDGSLKSMTLPAGGGLAAETITYARDAAGNPEWMHGGLGQGVYVSNAEYSPYGELSRVDLGSALAHQLSYEYESGTRRLTRSTLLLEGLGREEGATNLNYQSTLFTYDAAGNPTKVVETTRPNKGTTNVDAQCYRYDALRRLERVFTPASGDCASTPTQSTLGGPAPYWNEYAYNEIGNRTSEKRVLSSSNVDRSYTYGGAGAGPHAVTAASGGESYRYDESGNMTSRTTAGGTQSLSWDAKGRLVAVSGSGASTFIYTAEGDRLVRRSGSTVTVYLGDGMELTASSGGVSAKRYYSFAGRTVAVREGRLGSDVSVLAGDGQGTARVLVGNTTNDEVGAAKARYFDPFGRSRGGSVTWVGDRGFLGKSHDVTGLVQVGARYLDPNLGAFVSVDPIMDLSDPGQWHGYAYANSNPVTFSDPTGLMPWKARPDWEPPWSSTPSPEPPPVSNTLTPPVETGSGAGAGKSPSVWDQLGAKVSAVGSWAYTNRAQIGRYVGAVAIGVGAGVCIVASAGACAIAVGAVLVGGYANNRALQGMDPGPAAGWATLDAAGVATGGLAAAGTRSTMALSRYGSVGNRTKLFARGAANTGTLSGRTVLGSGWDDAIRAARNAKPEAGYFDVVAHGTPNAVFDAAGNAMSPSQLASVVRGTPSWAGQDVRLLSCSTGCPTGSFAQSLANELGVGVKAPTTDFFVNSRGGVVFDRGGSWSLFSPGS